MMTYLNDVEQLDAFSMFAELIRPDVLEYFEAMLSLENTNID
jgi:hypothetical protein